MDASYPKDVTVPAAKPPSAEEQLSEVFGSYKAEWLRERVFDFFTTPDYLPELLTARPCILVGGRGTGKTTVLRGLSYEGQFALTGRNPQEIRHWKHYGLYLRVNTNRVMAFTGPEVNQSTWIKLFGHYANLLLCDRVVQFLLWFQLFTNTDLELKPRQAADIADSLHMRPASSIRELASNLTSSRLQFEAYINNVADGPRPLLSMQGAPLDVLFAAITETEFFEGKIFFFLIDEYENLQDYQQQVVNTFIKHSGQPYTFKIGVKELGWRVRSTLNENEQLTSPADYVRINIVERLEGNAFKEFARSVCNSRLAAIRVVNEPTIKNIEVVLPGLTEEEEADRLGLNAIISDFISKVSTMHGATLITKLAPLELYLLKSWAEWQEVSYAEVVNDFVKNPQEWNDRLGNYKHALLFSIRRGKRGIRKYYAGWNIFTQLAANNIRYLLELVDQSLLHHVRQKHSLNSPISPETQTLAAQNVGRKNVSELEGLSVHGAQLTKLVLGLGRVFQVMAAQPFGHTPEVTQFHLNDDEDLRSVPDLPDEVDRLLKSAVMHLALVRSPANKLADEGSTKDYDYMIHPIFSAFFVFTHRRKRKMVVSAEELLGLIRDPQQWIPRILQSQNRTTEEELPEQALLFEGYYGRHS